MPLQSKFAFLKNNWILELLYELGSLRELISHLQGNTVKLFHSEIVVLKTMLIYF